MIERKVLLKTLDDVKKFVDVMAEKTYDVELLSGKYVVNAKSVMGVLSLDLTHPLTVIANVDNDEEFLENIIPYENAALQLCKKG